MLAAMKNAAVPTTTTMGANYGKHGGEIGAMDGRAVLQQQQQQESQPETAGIFFSVFSWFIYFIFFLVYFCKKIEEN